MLRTVVYRFRIIAPHVISTLYNVLWSDSRSGHFTKLCTYAHHEYQFLATLYSWNPRLNFFTLSNSHFLLKRHFAVNSISFIQKFHRTHIVQPHSLCQALLLLVVSSLRRASYKNLLAVYPAPHKTNAFIE